MASHDHHHQQGHHDHDHDHDHGHGHGHGGHDHSDEVEPALQKQIYTQIEFDRITTLNEAEEGAGKTVVKKTWANRLEAEPRLESDADEQLLMTIPYVTLPIGQTLLCRMYPVR